MNESSGPSLLEFAHPDNVILTNLVGANPAVLATASVDERTPWAQPESLNASHHRRGEDEFPHRGLKDFGFEELPFKRFPANAAFYCGMLIDIAAKGIRTGGQVILKVTQSVMTTLRFARLWTRCQSPPPIAPA